MRPRFTVPCLLLACAMACTSCATGNGATMTERNKRYAERCKTAPRLVAVPPRDRPASAQDAPVEGFSRESLAFAELLDLTPLIGRIPLTEAEAEQKRAGAGLRLMSLRQEVMQAILMATLEVSSASGEVRCEQARADRVADDMEKTKSRRYARLTLTSILITAVTSVVTGGFTLVGEAIADGVVAVTGGALGGLFGGLALLDSDDEYPFRHPRNHLKDIWEGPERSEVFSDAIWRYLNRRVDGADKKSLREQLIEDWRGKGRLGDPDSDDERRHIALLFGEGGKYSIRDLRARTEMLDELGTTIDLFYEALERLARESMARRAIAIE